MVNGCTLLYTLSTVRFLFRLSEMQSVVAGGKAPSKNSAIQEARKIDGIRISSIDEGRTTKLKIDWKMYFPPFVSCHVCFQSASHFKFKYASCKKW